MIDRRTLLASAAFMLATPLSSAFAQEAAPDSKAVPAAAQPFSFDALSAAMKDAATRPYEAPSVEMPEVVANLTYDEHRSIRFNPDKFHWAGEGRFAIDAFHPGWLFKEPVRLFDVIGGEANELHFGAKDFLYQPPLDATRFDGIELPGVAGFRLHTYLNAPDKLDELAAFLGASYFRMLGKGSVYGLSARGLAVNTATQNPEEFPRFTAFYVEKPQQGDDVVAVHATLDGPSQTGVMRFVVMPGETTRVDVTARFFLRADIERIGIAPMTSMFLFGGANRSAFDDYRERVHDSEGLAIVRRNGDEIWRPLNNPAVLANSFFVEENPRAFGLMQREREFDAYQDAGAHYERRPSLLIEPLNDWGKGSISLIEIPTELEVNDNIVCFWTPESPAKAGDALEFAYRMSWGTIPMDRERTARVVHFSAGSGGVSGIENEKGLRKFVIDFEGGALDDFNAQTIVKPSVELSGAEIVHATADRISGTNRWRLVLDLRPAGDTPVEMNASLTQAGVRVSEIWAYQWRVRDAERE